MATFADYQITEVSDLRVLINRTLKQNASLQEAAQKFTDILFEEFRGSTVLVRVFATVAYGKLPQPDKAFAARLAESRACATELGDNTKVMVLLGTRGQEKAWNDRSQSKAHLAVPLISASYIKTIPMVSRLMGEMSVGIEWIDKQKTRILVKTMGAMSRLIHVDDARTGKTEDGFQIVPDQLFVKSHSVKTVFGLGGFYLDRTFVGVIFFTKETMGPEQAERFMPLVHAFKSATMDHVMKGRIFA